MRVVVGINVPGGGSLVDSQALEAEVGRRRSTSLRRRIQDNFADYLAGREPVMRMSTSLLALCCQSGLVATLATPISARSRSIGSRSLRMSPLFIARFTRERSASWIRAYEASNTFF